MKCIMLCDVQLESPDTILQKSHTHMPMCMYKNVYCSLGNNSFKNLYTAKSFPVK